MFSFSSHRDGENDRGGVHGVTLVLGVANDLRFAR